MKRQVFRLVKHGLYSSPLTCDSSSVQTYTSSPRYRSCGRWPPSRWWAACPFTSSSTCGDASLPPVTPSWPHKNLHPASSPGPRFTPFHLVWDVAGQGQSWLLSLIHGLNKNTCVEHLLWVVVGINWFYKGWASQQNCKCVHVMQLLSLNVKPLSRFCRSSMFYKETHQDTVSSVSVSKFINILPWTQVVFYEKKRNGGKKSVTSHFAETESCNYRLRKRG